MAAPSLQYQMTSRRGIAPPGSRVWVQGQDEKLQVIREQLKLWLADVENVQELFRTHVYDNPNASQFDYRQHRWALYDLLAGGEGIALQLIELNTQGETLHDLRGLDQKLSELSKTLYAWHGPVEGAPDIPESFAQAMKEFAEGKATPMKF